MHPVIKILVIFHCVMILLWSLPNAPQSFQAWLNKGATPEQLANAPRPVGSQWLLVWNHKYFKSSPLHYYLTATGIWQYWDMFAPNPSNLDHWADARIVFADGSSKIVPYPRMSQMPIPIKYFKERYRKFLERANMDANAYLWPPMAQRLALTSTSDPNNLPVSVFLTRHWKYVQPMDKPQPAKYSEYMFYEHVVDQARLKKDLRLAQ